MHVRVLATFRSLDHLQEYIIFNAFMYPTLIIVYNNGTVRWLTRHLLGW